MQIGLLTDSLSTPDPRGRARHGRRARRGDRRDRIWGYARRVVARTARRHGAAAHRRRRARHAAPRNHLPRAAAGGFQAAGNPLHPVEGDRDDRVLRGALQLAEEFEVGTVVTMSGLPAAPGDRSPAWIATVWPPENLRLLEHQWTVAVDYWGDVAAEARRRGVRIAVEMHANQLVYNVPALLRLRAAVGDTSARTSTPATCCGWAPTRSPPSPPS